MAWLVSTELLFLAILVAVFGLAAGTTRPNRFRAIATIALIIGCASGAFSAFLISWSPSPTLRFQGFPFPAGIFHLEDGKWADFVGSPITAAMDISLFATVALLPILAWILADRRHATSKSSD